MIIREATIADIPQIQFVRHSVNENKLSNPALVTDKDCEEYMTVRGKGWVCEVEGKIAGFAIADLQDNNIWALFLQPKFEQQGIGRKLHDTMLNWYFAETQTTLWLSTSPNTRAASFYRKAGWLETGTYGKDELKFEMSHADWTKQHS
jgi:ribosomal protein S18 acetylase RimI-like enzyme